MANWKELAVELKTQQHEPTWLQSILSATPEITNPQEYSDFFKFLSISVRIRPTAMLPIVLKRILSEWLQRGYSDRSIRRDNKCDKEGVLMLFRGTVSFLIRLKKNTRRQFFVSEIFPLWTIIFSESFEADEYPKLMLVREFRRELSFKWLFSYICGFEAEPNPSNFFYSVNLSEFQLDCKAQASIDILIELLEKIKREGRQEDSDECVDLRVSGVLEKIGSLWRADALMNPVYKSKLLKLLALASLISGSSNNIFDSLPGLMDLLSSDSRCCVWTFRLVESIMKKYPTRQYVLSQSRAEISQISRQVIKISAFSLLNCEMDKSVCGMMKSVLERWESLTECPVEVESEFIKNVEGFLNDSYTKMINNGASDCFDTEFELLSVFIKYFINPLKPKLTLFFRNALKQATLHPNNPSSLINLNAVTGLLVEDGGTDLAFKKLFLDHPSLVIDVGTLIGRIENESKLHFAIWLTMLAESPRTRNVLIEFLVDPIQITFQLKSDALWMDFFSKILTNDPMEIEKILKWTQGKLVEEFYRRVLQDGNGAEFHSSVYVLIEILFNLEAFQSHELFPEILKIAKSNIQLLSWILSNLPSHLITTGIGKVLLEMVPFGNEQLARKVYGLIGAKLKGPIELIANLFTKNDSEDSNVDQWNLLVESRYLTCSIDEEFIELPSTDYSSYLEELFHQISNDSDSINSIVKESQDMIEMYLEYYKYGHVRSMRIIQTELIKRHSCVELLVRIPLVILKSGGKEFGARVLDDFIINGIRRDELHFIKEANADMLACLAEYYRDRLVE